MGNRTEVAREDLAKTLNEWRSENNSMTVGVAVDVGGTNTRVVFTNQKTGVTVGLTKFPGGGRVEKLLAEFNEIAKIMDSVPVHAASTAICLAGRVQGGGKRIELTNFEADARVMTLDQMPQTLFPPASTRFLNDLEAASYGLLSLAAAKTFKTHFASAWGPSHVDDSSAESDFIPETGTTYAVVAAGTGLGASLLVSLNGAQDHSVLPAEFGHCLIPWPAPGGKHTEEDTKFLTWLADKLSKGASQLEYEDIVSGRGLLVAYEYTSQGASDYAGDGGAIVAAAVKGHKSAVAAVTLFYRFLMQAVQNIAIASQAKAVFLAGDNQVFNEEFWAKHIDTWKEELYNHPKGEWMHDTTVYRQVKTLNMNLEGCVYVTRRSKWVMLH